MANSQRYIGEPELPPKDQPELTADTKNPITRGGWYECKDGSWARFEWFNGQLAVMRVVSGEEFAKEGLPDALDDEGYIEWLEEQERKEGVTP